MINSTMVQHISISRKIFLAIHKGRKECLKSGFSITPIFNRKGDVFVYVVFCCEKGLAFFKGGDNITIQFTKALRA